MSRLKYYNKAVCAFTDYSKSVPTLNFQKQAYNWSQIQMDQFQMISIKLQDQLRTQGPYYTYTMCQHANI